MDKISFHRVAINEMRRKSCSLHIIRCSFYREATVIIISDMNNYIINVCITDLACHFENAVNQVDIIPKNINRLNYQTFNPSGKPWY